MGHNPWYHYCALITLVYPDNEELTLYKQNMLWLCGCLNDTEVRCVDITMMGNTELFLQIYKNSTLLLH